MIIDNTPLRDDAPDDPRAEITLRLPQSVIDQLVLAQRELGIAASDLAAVWLPVDCTEALRHKDEHLGWMNHRDIAGWDPLGFPVLRQK